MARTPRENPKPAPRDSGKEPAEEGSLEEIRGEFVQLWGRMAPFWGISPSEGRVYGWLLSRSAPVDAEEIAAGLQMSRGAVSMACTELGHWGIVVSEREPGGRRLLYRAETNLEKAIRSIITTRKRREWDPILEHLREWIPKLDAQRSKDAGEFRERLQSIESLVAMADSMAEVFLKGGMVRQLGLKVLVSAASVFARSASRGSR
ncbi:MAG: hypothetical protein JNJ88_08605 [Planctomycetes bacterium]|nr:hypothetical protein [Planctomycetota bacterium]